MTTAELKELVESDVWRLSNMLDMNKQNFILKVVFSEKKDVGKQKKKGLKGQCRGV